jgi:Family of unknown function (DUF6134)
MFRSWQGLILVFVIAASQQVLPAAEKEQREYSVFIDGKEAGLTTIDIHQQDDGLTYVTTHASVKVTRLIIQYNLAIDSTECWRDGRLVSLKSQTKENGKLTNIAIAVDGTQLRANVNGQERLLPGEIWTSTFWKLPDAKFHNKELALFEIDTGKEFKGQLQYVGTEQLTILNKLITCYHFRYTGGATPTDVWFDSQHRLVRQEFVEMGHKTIGQLIRVAR